MKTETYQTYTFSIPLQEVESMWEFAIGRMINLTVYTIDGISGDRVFQAIMTEETYLVLRLIVKGIHGIKIP